MKIATLSLTTGGKKLARNIVEQTENSHLLQIRDGIAATLADNWSRFDCFICIMAAGIVVRAIAPLLRDKQTDPCVIVMDEKGSHVISLLSGHLGGGNQLAHTIAELCNGTAVITTASDTLNLVALDLWAQQQNLAVQDRRILTRASSKLVNQGHLKLYCETEVDSLPPGLILASQYDDADLLISNRKATNQPKKIPFFHPRNLIIGVGCNRGTPSDEFEEAITELLDDLGLSRYSIRNLASIDVKDDEDGLLSFAEKNGWPIEFYLREEINSIKDNVTISDAALKAVGAIGVAEPTALLSAKTNILLSRKRKWQNITMAVAKAPFTLSAQAQAHSNT